MESKEALVRSYQINSESARKFVEQNNLPVAKGFLEKALAAAIDLTKMTKGNEQVRYLNWAKSTGELLKMVKEKLKPVPQKNVNNNTSARNDEDVDEEAPVEVKEIEDLTIDEALAKLDSLIGLKKVKKQVHDWVSFVRVAAEQKRRGLPSPGIGYHMVFMGNPGTGKTTVARILGSILYSLGILSNRRFLEVSDKDLVVGYVRQTGEKTSRVLNYALGGVLFLDEAYALYKEGDEKDFGREAINTMVPFIENHRDDFVLICAGYRDEMNKFLSANTGLKSRFSSYLDFEDYDGDELYEIFCLRCKEYKNKFGEDTEKILRDTFRKMYNERNEKFGNGRDVRRLFEAAVSKRSTRLNKVSNLAALKNDDFLTFLPQDIPSLEELYVGME